jgi:hypothetical protein
MLAFICEVVVDLSCVLQLETLLPLHAAAFFFIHSFCVVFVGEFGEW